MDHTTPSAIVMSRDIVHTCLGTSFTFGLALVVAGGVEDQVAEEFVFAGEHPDVEVVDEDVGAGVAAADAEGGGDGCCAAG